jgi:hypothetical protein
MLNDLISAEQKEVRCYGCTVAQMREAVEQSLTFRFSGAAMMAMSLMSDAQHLIDDSYGDVDWMRREDARQTLNRAKWILSTYCMNNEVAA